MKLGCYLAGHFCAGLGLALVVLMVPFLLFSTVHQLGNLGQGGDGLAVALGQVLAEAPRLARDLLPAAILLGGAGAVAWLARSGQLWIMRGCGLARAWLVRWILGAALLVVAVDWLNSEYLVPAGAHFAQGLEALRQPVRGREFWLRVADEHVRMHWDPGAARARDITIYRYAPAGGLRRVLRAPSADFQPEDGRWRLREVREWSLESLPGGGIEVRRRLLPEVDWAPELGPRRLALLSLDAEQLPLVRLLDSGAALASYGRSARLYDLALWERLLRLAVLPLLALAALCMGAGVRPDGGLGRVLSAAVALSVLLLLGMQCAAALVLLLELHPAVMVWPPLLTALLAVPLARRL